MKRSFCSYWTITNVILTLIRLRSCFLLQFFFPLVSLLFPPLHCSPLMFNLIIQLQIFLKKIIIIKGYWWTITAELILYDSRSKTSQLPTSWHSFLRVLSAWYLSNRCSRSALSCSTSTSLSLSWVLQLASPSRTHTNMGTTDSTAPSPWVWMTAC